MLKTNNSLNDPKRRKRRLVFSCDKKLSVLLGGIPSKHWGVFYCLNCLHSLATKNNLNSHEKMCKNKGFSGIVMHS